jgi:hypothetical protein
VQHDDPRRGGADRPDGRVPRPDHGPGDDLLGTYDYAFSGGFFGRSLQATYAYTSRTCWNMNVTFNLSRN